MNISKLDFISAQTRSRIIKIITYLSKGDFKNFYSPRPISRSLQEKSFPNYPKKEQNSSFFDNNPSTFSQQKNVKNREFQEIPDNYENPSTSLSKNPYKSAEFPQSFTKPPYNPSRNAPDEYLSKKMDQKSSQNPLLNDFVNLLTPENSKEMLIFSLQNLDPIIDSIIDSIMASKEAYLKLLNLIEINLPTEYLPSQIKILESLNKNLTEARAFDGLQHKIVTRLLKAFSLNSSKLQGIFYSLLQTHLTMGRFRVDVPTLISMISCPFVRLQELGVKIMAELSDPNVNEFNNYDLQFENHIKFLLETSLSKKKGFEFKNSALMAIANLSLKDSLRPQIVYNSGIEAFLFHLRNEENLEGQRIAAKGLLNLSIKSSIL